MSFDFSLTSIVDIHVLLEAEEAISTGRSPFYELFHIPRNRRAMYASTIVMFMQQFCGVNVIAYYSSNIFAQSGFNEIQALLASFGFGLINWLFAFPAVYTIDTFGRRNLLLTTFPLMAIFLLLSGFSFFIPEGNGRLAVVALGIYLFGMAYSPGEGPVPFTYSAEAYPLSVRDIGMSWATSVLWFFNFVVAITFPRLLGAFTPQGAFGWYAGWNVIGFVLILLFVPETKALSLEELDQGPSFCISHRLLFADIFSSSVLCTHCDARVVPAQGPPAQHQEVHLPHERRAPPTSVRARSRPRGQEALRPRRCWPRIIIYALRHSPIPLSGNALQRPIRTNLIPPLHVVWY